MVDNKQKIEEFLEGNISINESAEDISSNDSGSDFIKLYKKVISISKSKPIEDFNPFEKIQSDTNKKQRQTSFKRILSVAASIVALVGFVSLYYYFNFPKKQKLTQIQIAEAQRETEQALLFFSKELNETLTNLKSVKYEPPSFGNLEKIEFEKIQLEIINPVKNFKIN